jgi:hypothetical protein
MVGLTGAEALGVRSSWAGGSRVYAALREDAARPQKTTKSKGKEVILLATFNL